MTKKYPSNPVRVTNFSESPSAAEATLLAIKQQTDKLQFDGTKLKTDATLSGTISINEVHITDPDTDAPVAIKTDGVNNAMVVTQNSQPLPTGAATEANILALIAKLTSDNLNASMVETIQQTGLWRGKAAMVWTILGRRAGFTSTTVLNDVKEFGNAVAEYPELSNSALDILSSNAADDGDPQGTGVGKVKVVYLDADNVLTESPEITLNGTTLVTNVLTGVNAVLWMEATAVGSGGVAAGNIRLRINGGTVEVEQISAGGNKSLSARVRIPAGYTAYLVSWTTHAINQDMDMRIRATVNTLDRTLSVPYHFLDNDYLPLNSDSHDDLAYQKLPAGADLKVSVLAAGTGAANRCDASVIMALVAD